jgi:glutamate transport system substrate-binding protein
MKTSALVRSLAAVLAFTAGLSGCSTDTPSVPLSITGSETGSSDLSDDNYVAPDPDPANEAGKVKIGDGQVLRVGIPFTYPGIGLMDEESGVPSGFAVDIAAYLAWKLGYSPYDIEWVNAPTAARVSLLQTDQVDMVVAPMSITPARAEDIDFAGPYLISGQDVLVRANDTSIKSKDDLVGKVVCTIPTSTGDQRMRDLFGYDITLVHGVDYQECIQKVVDGDADAVSSDDAILAGHASTDEFYRLVRLVGKPFSEERYGIGLPNGSHNLCLQVNQALTEMVQDGSWKKFIDRNVAGTHFFEDRYDNPPELDKCE